MAKKIINLPTKSVNIMELEFNHAERALYDSLYEFSKGKFEEFVRSGTVLKNYANILEMLLHLRQACDHPALILQSFQNKINTENLRAFFEQFSHGSNYEVCRQVLPILPQVLNDIDADIDALMEKNWVGSTKINSLVDQLQELKHTTKSVIFSQWTTMLDLVEIAFDRGHINYVRLDGKMSRKDRDKALHTFRTDPNVHACLFSLKAGGVGLNLVQATHVFLLDPWWNPAVEEQAINRVHRIGQNKPVVVVRFVIKNTIEQRILKLQQNKTELAQGLGMQDGDDDGDDQLKLGMTKKDLQQIRLEDLHSMFADDDKDEDKDELDVDDDEFTDL
jgi:DNA repair protein RAD16